MVNPINMSVEEFYRATASEEIGIDDIEWENENARLEYLKEMLALREKILPKIHDYIDDAYSFVRDMDGAKVKVSIEGRTYAIPTKLTIELTAPNEGDNYHQFEAYSQDRGYAVTSKWKKKDTRVVATVYYDHDDFL